MWDGYWFLANRRTWQALPEDVRAVAAKHINQSALDQRADLEALNTGLQADLAAKGLAFNAVDKDLFRDKLREAGFYAEWRGKYGDRAWALLEGHAGKLP